MTSNDFYRVTSLLEEFYGKKLNNVQARVWCEKLKAFSSERYEMAVNRIFEEKQYMPTLSQILETITIVRPEVEVKETVKCEACKGTGYISYKQVENGFPYEYFALCNCKNSIGKEYDGNKCAQDKTNFYIPKAENIFLKG